MASRNIHQGESGRCIMQNLQTCVNDSGITLKLEKSKEKFVTTPFVNFGNLRVAAFKHEFGTKSHELWYTDPC